MIWFSQCGFLQKWCLFENLKIIRTFQNVRNTKSIQIDYFADLGTVYLNVRQTNTDRYIDTGTDKQESQS